MIVQRGTAIGQALPGEMTIDGRHAAWTLERVAVAIPAGRYAVVRYYSPHFGREMPMLADVPGRSEILIHWGDYPWNSDGCLLVGETMDPSTGDIYNTQKEWNALWPAIDAAIDAAEGCSIEIREALTPDASASSI